MAGWLSAFFCSVIWTWGLEKAERGPAGGRGRRGEVGTAACCTAATESCANPQRTAAVQRLFALWSLPGCFSHGDAVITRRTPEEDDRCPLYPRLWESGGEAGAADNCTAAPAPCPTSTVSVPKSQSPPDCRRAFLEITGVSPLSRPKDSGYFPTYAHPRGIK